MGYDDTTQSASAPAGTWSIVATCAEPRRLIEGFIAHHLALGADEIFLFFDDPCDVTSQVLGGIDGVRVIVCDSTYWSKRKGRRPEGHRQRQTYNAEYATKRLCKSEWIAHIDADEFLHSPINSGISELLKTVPDEYEAARVLPLERAFYNEYVDGSLEFSGVFKPKGLSEQTVEELYQEHAPLFPGGFQGHEVGKSFRRMSSKGTRFNIHFVRRDGVDIDHFVFPQSDFALLHLFPASYLDWKHKYERRVDNKNYFDSMPAHAQERYSLFSAERAKGEQDSLRTLFNRLCVIPKDRADNMIKEGSLIRIELKIPELIKAIVAPYRTADSHFSHVKESSSVGTLARFFQIGMNRAGSKEICSHFGTRGYSYAHWDKGRIAKRLARGGKNGKPLLKEYDGIHLLSDIEVNGGDFCYEGFYDFERLFEHFPSAIFILNYRPIDEWIRSRTEFRDGQYLESHRIHFNLKTAQDVKDKWESDWLAHVRKLHDFEKKGLRLIEWPIYTQKPSLFFSRIDEMLLGHR